MTALDRSVILPEPFARWFAARGWTPRAHQLELLAKASAGRSVLLIAPTGGGKTLAGFLPSLIELSANSLPRLRGRVGEGASERQAAKALAPTRFASLATSPASGGGLGSIGRDVRREGGLHTLYISPLKALTVDIARNLEAPVAEMGLPIRIETRTWPDEKLLVVADLHLEKGSAFAARGVLLPPYDTAETLARLAILIHHYAPRRVIALGDNFHDGGGPARMAETDRAALAALQRGRDWLWIAGNHDPEPADNIGGDFVAELALGPFTFRHQPTSQPQAGEVAGHLHPVARVARRGRAVSRRCFVGDGERLVMPAFGAYAGGLNVRDRAFTHLFGTQPFTAHLLGARRLYAVAAAQLLPD